MVRFRTPPTNGPPSGTYNIPKIGLPMIAHIILILIVKILSFFIGYMWVCLKIVGGVLNSDD